VESAFLARVTYDGKDPIVVALCLRAQAGSEREVATHIGQIFAGMFGSNQHLDTMFLRDSQEREISAVCKPFYTRVL
jgi:hypothetical protein